jgi:hypothetical protein
MTGCCATTISLKPTSPDSAVDFEAFRERVLASPALLETLRGTPDQDAFVTAVVRSAAGLGFQFTNAEVEAALRVARREWIERWIE